MTTYVEGGHQHTTLLGMLRLPTCDSKNSNNDGMCMHGCPNQGCDLYDATTPHNATHTTVDQYDPYMVGAVLGGGACVVRCKAFS